MLRPQRMKRLKRQTVERAFSTHCISYFSSFPKVMNSPWDFPAPAKSKQQNCSFAVHIVDIAGMASSLLPQLPCRYTTHISFWALDVFCKNTLHSKYSSRAFFTWKSTRFTFSFPRRKTYGPSSIILYLLLFGRMKRSRSSSKTDIRNSINYLSSLRINISHKINHLAISLRT